MSPSAWVAVAAVAAAMLTFVIGDVPVDRRRLQAFADRHGVVVTAANAPDLVRYLALTRRWRAAGLVGAMVALTVHSLQHQRININILIGLAGWFAGAVVAELRATSPSTVRRVAALVPRTVDRYATPAARSALLGTAGLALLAAIVAVALGQWSYGLLLVGAAVGLPLLVLTAARRVALRRQPVQPPDVVAADEAVRRNAVQALYAAALTMLLYGAAGPFLAAVARGSAPVALLLTVGCMVGIPVLGWRLGPARARWPVGGPAR